MFLGVGSSFAQQLRLSCCANTMATVDPDPPVPPFVSWKFLDQWSCLSSQLRCALHSQRIFTASLFCGLADETQEDAVQLVGELGGSPGDVVIYQCLQAALAPKADQ